MKSAIDRSGRLVIPKSLRDELGFLPGADLVLEARDGRLEIEAVPTEMRLKGSGREAVAVAETDLPPLTAEQVRATLEQTRR